MRTNGSLCLLWKELITRLGTSTLGPDSEAITHVCVIQHFDSSRTRDILQVTDKCMLSSDELNVIRYVCGYVICMIIA